MGAEILVTPENLWGVIRSNEDILKSGEQIVASNDEFGVEICIAFDHGAPTLVVYMDSEPVHSEMIHSQADCEATARRVYDKFLGRNVVNAVLADEDGSDGSDGFEEISSIQWDDMIDFREGELDDAVTELIYILEPKIDDFLEGNSDIIDDIKDLLCEHLYEKYGISVYRPMILEDDDGSDYFTEYPYPELEFE